MIRGWLFLALITTVGCSTSRIIDRVVIKERVDSIMVKGDTIFIDMPSDTIVWRDTVFQTHAFIARIDTTIQRTGVRASYQYPENRWAVRVVNRDTVVRYVVRDSLIERTVERQVEVVPKWMWWFLIAIIVVGLAIIVRRIVP